MKPDLLLTQFERISDAPDAIASLRQFILELAVRGKLVDRNSNDEPAAALLKRIQAEKARRIKGGHLKKQEPRFPEVRPEETWFDNAPGWCWVRLGAISEILMGQSPPGNTYNKTGEGLPLINGPVEFTEGPFGKTVINQYTTAPTNICEEGDLLLCVRGSTTGRTNVAGFRACIGRGVAAIRPFIADHYIRLFIWRLRASIIAMGRGIAFPSVSRQQIEQLPVPLPPFAEQVRIVAKVDELMALCDRLEVAREQREEKRDRLATASLARLSKPDLDSSRFADHARFVLDNFAAITTRHVHVKQLRETILNLAVRGRLVPQDPRDEPASQLISEIDKNRKRLLAEKRIPKPTQLPPINELDYLFPIPVGWSWAMLGTLCYQISDGPHFSPQYVGPDEGVPFLSTRNVRLEGFDLSSVKYVSRSDHAAFCKRIRPEKGDIIYTKGGTTGIAKVNDLDFEFSVWVHLAVLRIEKERLFPRYIELALNSPHCYAQSQLYTRGISNFDLGLTRMVKITIPLPPLAEQRQIVAKVDELMARCYRLEAQLESAQTGRRLLLDAILDEALNYNHELYNSSKIETRVPQEQPAVLLEGLR